MIVKIFRAHVFIFSSSAFRKGVATRRVGKKDAAKIMFCPKNLKFRQFIFILSLASWQGEFTWTAINFHVQSFRLFLLATRQGIKTGFAWYWHNRYSAISHKHHHHENLQIFIFTTFLLSKIAILLALQFHSSSSSLNSIFELKYSCIWLKRKVWKRQILGKICCCCSRVKIVGYKALDIFMDITNGYYNGYYNTLDITKALYIYIPHKLPLWPLCNNDH